MRVLERDAEISTRYGGGFVQSIDGLEADERFGRSFDWFFYVNGVESTVGAADYALHGGEAIWWDYRDWSAADAGAGRGRLLAAAASSTATTASARPVAVECRGGGAACGAVRGSARRRPASARRCRGSADDAIRVLVGPWARLRERPGRGADRGRPAGERRLRRLRARRPVASAGRPRRRRRAGARLRPAPASSPPPAATTRRRSGSSPARPRPASLAAAGLLDAAHLRDRYAVATEGGRETPLPVRPR